MSRSSLSGKDICEIIKVAGESGVSSLKHGCFEVSFARKDAPVSPATIEAPQVGGAINDKIEVSPELEAEIKHMQLETLMLEDPAAFEEWALTEDAKETHGQSDSDF